MARLSGVPRRIAAPAREVVAPVERLSARDRGYTARWDRLSANYRATLPVCLGCRAMGLIGRTAVTDHVVPHRGDASLMWDPANWQPACAWHHDDVKQRLEAMYDAGQLGPDDLRLDSATAVALARTLLATRD
jgi:5-methylcytosine-specific restriction endonuclease McrA